MKFYCIAQTSLELTLLPQPPMYWDERHVCTAVPSSFVFIFVLVKHTYKPNIYIYIYELKEQRKREACRFTSLHVVCGLPVYPWVFCNLLLILYCWRWNREPTLLPHLCVCVLLRVLCTCMCVGGWRGCGHTGRCVCMSV